MATSRHLAPDGVVVRQKHLNAESLDRRFQTNRRTIDMTSGVGGRVSGLEVTVTSSYFINVSPGFGYTPRGDYVALDSATGPFTTGIDYTDGAVNYIVLPFTETKGDAEAHESRGTTSPTLATHSGAIQALTATEYDALSDNYSSDLATDIDKADTYSGTLYKDSLLVVARVVGAGFTAGTPNALTIENNVQQEAYVSPLVTCSFDNDPDTVEGMNIKSVVITASLGNLPDPAVPGATGTASLTWDGTTDPAELYFTAPGDAVGAVANFTWEGGVQPVEVTSANGDKITVEVVPELFPRAAGSTSMSFSLLYDEWGPIFTTADQTHRNKVGSYIPTDTLPHGEGFADLAQIVGVVPQAVSVGSGLIDTDDRALYPKIVSWGRNGTSTFSEHLELATGGGTTGYTRFYTRSDTGQLIVTVNAKWDGTNWDKDVSGEQASKIVLHWNGGVSVYGRDSDTAWTDAEWTDASSSTGGPLVDINAGAPSTASRITLKTTEEELFGAMIDLQRSLSRQRILKVSRPADSAADNTIAVYHTTLSDNNAGPLEIVGNAYYDTGSGVWTKHNSSASAFKLEIGRGNIVVAYRQAASVGTWADSAWDDIPFDFSLVNGHLDITGNFTAENVVANNDVRATNDFQYLAARTVLRTFQAGDAAVALSGTSTMTSDGSGGIQIAEGAAGTTYLHYHLDIPDGADFTSVVCNNVAVTFPAATGEILRVTHTTGASSSLMSGGPQALAAGTNTFLADQNATVDLTTYRYVLTIILTSLAAAGFSASGGRYSWTVSVVQGR